MGTIFFSSGTSGNQPKAIIYSNEDLQNMKTAMKHFFELCPIPGVVYNLLPPYPMIHPGILGIDKCLKLFENIPPTALIGLQSQLIELVSIMRDDVRKNLKNVVVVNGITEEGIKFFKDKNLEVYATYGLTEAKMAWLTCSDLNCGYHVFPDSKIRFEVKDGELILFSPDYPDGYPTGDLGEIIGEGKCPVCGRVCQRIGLFIHRKDNEIKTCSMQKL